MQNSYERQSGNPSGGALPEKPVALVLADFMFGARVQAALSQIGWTPVMAGAPGPAMERVAASRPDLVLVELGAGNPARIQFIRDLRARPEGSDLPVLAFGSHKAKAMLEEARDAGSSMVVSNGTLVSRFEEVVRKTQDAALAESDRFLVEEDD